MKSFKSTVVYCYLLLFLLLAHKSAEPVLTEKVNNAKAPGLDGRK